MPPQLARRATSIIDTRYTLRRLFRKESFRAGQEEIINAALEKHDILVIFPVGHGKSLTYQLPAVATDHGCTIVISPLLALMANQVDSLEKHGIKAVSLNSNVSIEDRKWILHDLACGHPHIRLLYVSPELCAVDSFRKVVDTLYKQGELNRLVIDEAHCCVEWGHSFRVHYTQLGYFKQRYPDLPITALTATAPAGLRKEIINILKLPNEPLLKVFTSNSNRRNLHYEVRYLAGQDIRDDIVEFLTGYSTERPGMPNHRLLRGQGIIYCRQRNTTEILAAYLQSLGFGARPFHAQIKSPQEKATIMNKWIDNDPDYQVIIATVAFGMGVDKPDVRFVIHHDLPANIESYYQGSGRAGRDNKASRCILYYSRAEAMSISALRARTISTRRTRKQPTGSDIQSDDKGTLYVRFEMGVMPSAAGAPPQTPLLLSLRSSRVVGRQQSWRSKL
ncbi:ATP-dependent DNA helicase SGS1 [Sugiyamaella lignohabitans]|uniref:DNA 3'-5' helicase n=1 Tax=Sugiyamaella lignohabitans TaxID=796027 RepID=A0A167C7W9_9ASCO|nr:ATP-dependent DNA helicase SGS1 [Sugiyamaella lignohabitans]ANB11333.1 ATP-dependent DNA helicase SGS1 [Sugiyamaella lignohabitans]